MTVKLLSFESTSGDALAAVVAPCTAGARATITAAVIWLLAAGDREMIGAERQRERRLQEYRKVAQGLLEGTASPDADIEDAVRGSPAWREKAARFLPGVGPTSSRPCTRVQTGVHHVALT
jgi:hypothetical protein